MSFDRQVLRRFDDPDRHRGGNGQWHADCFEERVEGPVVCGRCATLDRVRSSLLLGNGHRLVCLGAFSASSFVLVVLLAVVDEAGFSYPGEDCLQRLRKPLAEPS